MIITKKRATSKEIPIILCAGANGRCVIYGYVDELPEAGQPVTLRRARMILRWRGGGGLLGVAARGPREGSQLTHAVASASETRWQEWIECSPEAAREIDAWPAS